MASETPFSRSVAVESTSSGIVGVCKDILSELEARGFKQDDIFAVHLALEEAFINAVKHGNRMDPTKEVKISYSVSVNKVEITMGDEGGGFEPNSIPDPRYGDNLYRTEGRGLFLIRSYMDVVKYNERGNVVRMVKYREKQHQTKGDCKS